MPESFVVDIGIKNKCLIPFAFNDKDEYVLGEPFFRNFYSVFDDSKGLLGIAPSINFVSSSIVEGMVPNDELPHPNDDSKVRSKPSKDNKPKQSGGITGIFKYVFDTVTGLFTGKKPQESMPSGTYTTIIEYGGIAVVIGTLMCCCASVGIYIAYSYLTMGTNAPPPQAAGPQRKGKASKKVKASRLGGDEEGGVSMSNLLTAADIQDRIDEIKCNNSSANTSSDEEP